MVIHMLDINIQVYHSCFVNILINFQVVPFRR